ncbi:Spy0128 family protein [Enterococcus sp. DIV0187]|jgi:hypothetical protein|uniref:Spy0128 family protein n=1 Tax=Enterococcus sp. DIV0187 TaxID=2774644 RepID=UPI003A3859B1
MMNKCWNNGYLLFFTLLASIFLLMPEASAQAAIRIPIEQEFRSDSNSVKQSEKIGIYQLDPLAKSNPMPYGKTPFQFKLVGNQKSVIEGFTFLQEGTYSYKLYQQPVGKSDFSYDDQVYLITVYVMNTTDGRKEEVTVENKEKLKVMTASFINHQSEVITGNTSSDLSNTKDKEQKAVTDSKRRLPNTGQLAENIWVIGLFLLLIIYILHHQKKCTSE